MVVKLPKKSPSLVDLRGSVTNIQRFDTLQDKYVLEYEEIAAFKRRKKSDYEMLLNNITSLMLEELVDYLKKEKVTKLITFNKDEHAKDISDEDDIEYSTSEYSTSEYSEKSILIGNTQNVNEIQKYENGNKINQNKLEENDNLDAFQTGDEGRDSIERMSSQCALKETLEDERTYKMFSESESFDVNVDALFKNGNRYQGRLSCYLMEGEAIYKWSDGTTYKATFTDGIAGGSINIVWPDGSWYDGEVKRNRRHGKGICIIKKDNVPKMAYFGNWKKGKTNGKGMIIYGENNWYDGYWKKGRPDGFGLRQYPSGSRYLGEIKNGKEHGFGSMIWSNHDMYSGYWINGKMEGEGTYTWNCIKFDGFVQPMQNTYIGQWKDRKRHGQGRLLLTSGAVIDTLWVNDIKEGPGQIICKNGFVIESTHLFKNDRVYQLDSPVMIPFWNTWYCEFLSHYRSGLFYVQPLKDDISENKGEKKVGEETQNNANLCSNNIPILAPVESLPLWEFVLKSVCQPIHDLTGEISYLIRADDVELLSFEEMWLRKVIANQISAITCLYQHYATIICKKKPSFKACMFRFMLCQMIRDSGLDETDFNLCELDAKTGYDSYPFATILLFQVIHYLLVLAHELCVKKKKANPNIPGKWGGAFDYFLTYYALPGMQKTNQMAELCNTIPLKHVLILYETIGVPVTIKKIFNYFFHEHIRGPTIEKPFIKMNRKMNGQNKIYPDGRIVYENPDGTLLGTMLHFEEDHSKYFDLNNIKLIGKMQFIWNLYEICPKAKKNNLANNQYEVSYLEFCEFIKLCLKKYKDIINPDSEIDCYYEIENETSEESTKLAKETDDNASSSTGDGEIITYIEIIYGTRSGTCSNLTVEDPQNSKILEKNICRCMKSKLVEHDGGRYKICKCEDSCDSDCKCFCHKKNVNKKVVQKLFKYEHRDLEETKLIDLLGEGSDAHSTSTRRFSDTINYICKQTSDEEDIKEIKKSSSEERISDCGDYFRSDLDLEGEKEFDDEGKEKFINRKDVKDTTNKFLSVSVKKSESLKYLLNIT